MKVEDNLLLYGKDYLPHHSVNDILARCRSHSITLDAKKFLLATKAVFFCRYQLSHNSAADPREVHDIKDFVK